MLTTCRLEEGRTYLPGYCCCCGHCCMYSNIKSAWLEKPCSQAPWDLPLPLINTYILGAGLGQRLLVGGSLFCLFYLLPPPRYTAWYSTMLLSACGQEGAKQACPCHGKDSQWGFWWCPTRPTLVTLLAPIVAVDL